MNYNNIMDRRLAAIDIGTNTFRLIVGEIRLHGADNQPYVTELLRRRDIVRLGEGIAANNKLTPNSMKRGIEVLKKFRQEASGLEAHEIRTAATSALREALNSKDLIRRAKDEAGIEIRIISGEEEARLTAAGMLFDLGDISSALLIDIGGGSTELIFTRDKVPEKFESRKIGVVYLAEKYMRSDPPSRPELEMMENRIADLTNDYSKSFMELLNDKSVLVGTAGTITALSALNLGLNRYDKQKIHHSKLTIDNVQEMYNRLSNVSSEERGRMMPFEPQRLDIIVPGAFILLSLMRAFDKDEITVSDYGLLEGMLIS